jgi:hypothetical protein
MRCGDGRAGARDAAYETTVAAVEADRNNILKTRYLVQGGDGREGKGRYIVGE